MGNIINTFKLKCNHNQNYKKDVEMANQGN